MAGDDYDRLTRDICMASIALRGHREPLPIVITPDRRVSQRLAAVEHVGALVNTGDFGDVSVTVASIPRSESLHGLVVALDPRNVATSRHRLVIRSLSSTLSAAQLLAKNEISSYARCPVLHLHTFSHASRLLF